MGLPEMQGYDPSLNEDPVHLEKYISLRKYSIPAPIRPQVTTSHQNRDSARIHLRLGGSPALLWIQDGWREE